MADNVSELQIELEAPSEQAEAGIEKLASALSRLKKAVNEIDIIKLESLKSSIQGFSVSLEAAKAIDVLSKSMKTLAISTGDWTTRQPRKEVSEFEKSLKNTTSTLMSMYGVPEREFKSVEKQLREAALSTDDVKKEFQQDLFGNKSASWAEEIAKQMHRVDKVFVEAGDDYKKLVSEINAVNANPGSIKLNFSYKELQAENKNIAKTLGQGFTFNDRIDKAQTSFDSWIQGLSDSSKVLLGATGDVIDYAKVFERLVEVKNKYGKTQVFEVENGSLQEMTDSAQNAIDVLRYVLNREVSINKEEKQADNQFPQHLKEVVDATNGLSVTAETGTALKEVGTGFKSIAASVIKLSGVDTDKFHDIVDTVSSIGATLGNLGSNNKVSIKISADGVKGSVKALENVKEQFDGLRQKAQQASQVVGQTTSDNVSEEDREIAKHAENIKRLDDLIQKRKEYAAIIAGMERGSVGINVDTFIKARDALEKVNKEIAELSSQMGKSVEFVAADTIAQKLTPIIRDIEKYKALISDMDKGNIAFDEEQYINAKRKIEELTKEYQKLADTLSKKLRATGLDGLSQTIQGVIDKQKELQQTISGMESGQLGFDWKQYQKSVVEVDKLTNAMQQFRTIASMGTPKGLQMLGGAFKDLGSKMNSLANFGSKALKIFAAPFVAISNQIRKQTTNIKADFEKMSKGVQAATKKMSDFWKRSMKTFSFMLVRKAITAVLGDVKTAVDSLAIWSKHMGTPFNDSISNIVADFKYMARAILAAVEPLINAVAPILDKLADLLSNLSQKVASFFAILTGQNYIMKAKKNVTDYAKSVEKASKTAKNGLQSFDELNNITTNQDQQAQDPLAGWKDEWEKLPVDETMRDLADKIKQIAKDLWWPIGQAWDAMKDYVLGGWKYMTEQIKLLAKDIWRDFLRVWKSDTVVDIFKDIFGIVGDIEYGIGHLAKHFREAWNNNENGYHILKNIAEIVKILTEWARQVSLYFRDWANKRNFNPLLESLVKLTESLKRVADFAGGVFYDVMTKGVMEFIGWFIDKGLPDINNAIANVLDAFNFDKIRKDLQPVIVAIEKLLEHLVGGVTKAFEALGKHLAEWFNSDSFTRFTQAIVKILGVFTEDRIATVLEGIGLAFMHIAEAIADIVSSDTVVNLFENIGKWIDEQGVEGIASKIETLVKAILLLKGGGTILSGIGLSLEKIAKIKFMWDIGTIATNLSGAGKAASIAKVAFVGLGKALLVVGAAIGGFMGGQKLFEFLTGDKITQSPAEQFKTIAESLGDGSWKDAIKLWGEDIKSGFLLFADMEDEAYKDIQEKALPLYGTTGQLLKGTQDIMEGKNPFQGFVDDVTNLGTKISTFVEDSKGGLDLWAKDIENGFLAIADAESETISPAIDKMRTKFDELKTNSSTLREDMAGAWELMGQDIAAWWDEKVAPWFTAEKWMELAEGVKVGIKTKWDETAGQWLTDLNTFWEENLVPWFSLEKWTQLLSNIAPAFKTAFKDAVNGAIGALNKLLEGLEKLINDALGGDGLGKLSEYAAKLGVDVELDFSPIKLPKIPTFASGGIVEDGLFFANHNEMIGGFGNGKTAVANNDQITTGIANAVSNANAESNALMRQMVGLMEQFVDKDFSIGDDAVYASYKRGEARYTKRYGY